MDSADLSVWLQKLDVQTCIDIYEGIAKEVFTPRKRTLIGGRFIHSVFGSPAFSGIKLEKKIEEVLASLEPPLPGDVPLLCHDMEECKV